MITSDQLVIHAIGDYVLQSDWMASKKTKQHWAAFCHALVYSLGFVAFRPSLTAWLVIFGTHFLIDRYRLARYVVWLKNWLAPRVLWHRSPSGDFSIDDGSGPCPPGTHWYQPTPPFSECSATGYPPNRPAWLAVWLLIAADNIIHVCINGAALRFL